jgi:dienelactone hydrolase
MRAMSLSGFSTSSFTHDGATRTVYRKGKGPGVIVMHEMPGITPTVRQFAERVADAGFTVVLPHLFGTPDKPMTVPYTLGQIARGCVSREFKVLAAREASPITEWLRALCRSVHAEIGGEGVGALGMCFTGNFALALMVDESVMAPVLSQPSLPFGIGAERRAGLHVSDEQLLAIKRRPDRCPVLGLRFTEDWMVPRERFDHLRAELGDRFEAIESDSRRGNPHGIDVTAHSVLTHHFVDREGHPTREALDRVLGFFKERLLPDR